MTIWLLAVLLLACCGALGYRQGIIRVAFSFIGIIVAALLAVPLGGLIRPIVASIWAKNPVMAWAVPPLIIFVVISILFKVAAAPVHHKVDMFQKYKAGDLRLALWERLNHRLGLCLGLFNGFLYFLLISFIVFAFSYWTFQVATSNEDPRSVRIINKLGEDLQGTGFAKVARSIDGLSPNFYKAADVVGLVYANPLVEARLATYPAFLGLSERPEYQQLASDSDFIRLRQERKPIKQIMDNNSMAAILANPETLRTTWGKLTANLQDLTSYLHTGKSAKYDSELILGRWNFNVNAALSLAVKAKPNISSKEMQKVKQAIIAAFRTTTLLATTENEVIIKNAPGLGLGAGGPPKTLTGTWKSTGAGNYDLTFPDAGSITALAETDRLTITGTGVSMIFNRAY